MQKFATSISVIIPCYNEKNTIYANLLSIHQFLDAHFSVFELIAVNDGSIDSTEEELRRAQKILPIRVIHNAKNSGKGSAVRQGALLSKYDIILFLDADLAIPIESLCAFIPKLEEGYDLVIASRFIPGLEIKKPILWYRQVMEKVFRLFRMLILQNFSIRDTQCGFKLFTREAAIQIFSQMTINRFAFDSEIIFLASKKKYRVKELPIVLQNPTQSSIRIIRDSCNMIADLIRIRLNSLRGIYDQNKK